MRVETSAPVVEAVIPAELRDVSVEAVAPVA
jgi:hypothetical protein